MQSHVAFNFNERVCDRARARGMNRTSSTGILCNLVLVRKIYAEEVIEEVIRSERN